MSQFTTIVARIADTKEWRLMTCEMSSSSFVFDLMHAVRIREGIDMVARVPGTAAEYLDDFFGNEPWPTDDLRRKDLLQEYRGCAYPVGL